MRINVYAEEIPSRNPLVQYGTDHNNVEFITKTLDDGRVFYGIRMYLLSPTALHATPEDDDRSAITFWVRWTKGGGNQFGELMELFHHLHAQTMAAQDHYYAPINELT